MKKGDLAALVLTVLACGAAGAQVPERPPVDIEDTPTGQRRKAARDLKEEALALYRAGDLEGALAKLEESGATDPTYFEPWRWAGHIHEQRLLTAPVDQRDLLRADAIQSYCRARAISPTDEFTGGRLAALFFRGEFPRLLYPEALTHGPAGFVFGECLLGRPGATTPAKRGYAYTASVIFAPELPGQTGMAVWPADPLGLGRYNRVSYGYVDDPDEGLLRRVLTVYFAAGPLATVVDDRGPLAARAANALLRFRLYAQEYLDRAPGGVGGAGDAGDAEVRIWLSESGAAGAERVGNDLLLYDINTERPAIEWLRELAHEWGHLALPQVGGFEAPEKTAEGYLGESLLLGYLADEAEEMTGRRLDDPATQQLLASMWSGEAVDLASHLESRWTELVAHWLEEAPDSPLLVARSAEAMDYFLGLALYVAAAHGDDVLARVLSEVRGRAVPDFVRTYKDTVAVIAAETGLALAADMFVPAASDVASNPFSRVSRADGITLAPNGHATYRIYTAEGVWNVLVEAQGGQATLSVAVDGSELGEAHLTQGGARVGCELGELADGWHQLRLRLVEAPNAVAITRLVLSVQPG